MPINLVVPDLGESVVEATVLRWLKQEGEPVALGESIVELETDKVNVEVRAPGAGVVAHIEHKAGAEVKVGDVLGSLEPAAAPSAAPPPAPSQPEARSEPPAGKEEIKATPLAERMAAEYQIDLHGVPASSNDGRITRQDVENYLDQEQGAAAPPAEKQASSPPPPEPSPLSTSPRAGHAEREEHVKMSRRRQTIARRLVEGQHAAAMLTTFNEIDMRAVMEIRKQHKESFKLRYGVSLGIAVFFVKASIGALKVFPQLNAEIQDDEIVLKHYYDIGVAVSAPEGLVVPVLRDADRMSLVEIEQAISELARQAQNNTLTLQALRGGTFTITNGGVFGSMLSTPILNPPQVGILGLHKIEERPIAREGQVVIRPMMYVALSYDHRVVDGREAVGFLVRVKELIEDPTALLLEG